MGKYMLRLDKINAKNVQDVLKLNVSENQKALLQAMMKVSLTPTLPLRQTDMLFLLEYMMIKCRSVF